MPAAAAGCPPRAKADAQRSVLEEKLKDGVEYEQTAPVADSTNSYFTADRVCAKHPVCDCPNIVDDIEAPAMNAQVGFGTAACVWAGMFGYSLSQLADGSRAQTLEHPALAPALASTPARAPSSASAPGSCIYTCTCIRAVACTAYVLASSRSAFAR